MANSKKIRDSPWWRDSCFPFQGCNEDKLIHGHQTVSVVFKLTVINKQASEKEHYNILTNQEP